MTLPNDDVPSDLTKLRDSLAALGQENKMLREQVRLLMQRLYGRKSEQLDALGDLQMLLFAGEGVPGEPAGAPKKTEEVKVPAHTRRKRGRQPLPESLPRVERIHDVSEADKICGCGATKARIGEEVSEQLDMVPARMQVLRHVRPKYACRHCEGAENNGAPTVVIAPPPAQIIPKSLASPGLLAHVVTAKFADALPLYRQEGMFARLGVPVKRGTMCGWMVKVAEACAPVLEWIRKEILAGPLINCDETPLQVLKEPGRDATTESYMWVFRGGDPEHPLLHFVYDPSRERQVAENYLRGFVGFVQTDGYGAYDFLDAMPGVVHLGCLVHVRRGFVDVVKASSRPLGSSQPSGIAEEAVLRIAKIYEVERMARDSNLTRHEIRALRLELAKPKLNAMKTWLEDLAPKVPPRSLLGKAIYYALHQWARVERYFDDGILRPDNNLAENAIRPFVVGRKNWLFSGTPEGAKATATLYSLVESAKANRLDPYWYLRRLFDDLPLARSRDDCRALLPSHIDRAFLNRI